MRLIALAAFAGLLSFGFAGQVEAGKATTVETTLKTVNEACGTHSAGVLNVSCNRKCGSTTCDYKCKEQKCTVTINRKVMIMHRPGVTRTMVAPGH